MKRNYNTQVSARECTCKHVCWGGGRKKIAVSLGGVRPEKKIPPLCVKKFRNPTFFDMKNATLTTSWNPGGYFILCRCRLHNALRSPNIPHFGRTNLVALHIPVGPKFGHHQRGCWLWGPKSFGSGKIGQNDPE